MKRALFIIFLIILLLNNVKAQENFQQGKEDKEITSSIGANIESLNILGKIGIFFCDTPNSSTGIQKNLELNIRPGQTKNFCVIFYNQNEEEVRIIAGFSSGNIGKYGEFLCNANYKLDNGISQYFQSNQKNKELKIKPKETIIITGKIVIPENISGKLFICLGATLLEKEKIINNMFKLQHRKGSKIILNINGKKFQRHEKIMDSIKNHKKEAISIILIIISIRLIISIIQTIIKTKK